MYTLPQLPYSYDALEPVIDAQTMEIHHTRHHQTYIDKLNAGLTSYPQYHWLSVEELLVQFDTLPDSLKPVVRNHGGGHANHSLFWTIMCTQVESEKYKAESTKLMEAIAAAFGSFESFVEQFTTASTNQFGSGWAWLVQNSEGNLQVISTSNQDSPLLQWLTPLMGIDVREHAYYLTYQNKRADYIRAWLSIVNWREVEENLWVS